MSRQIVAEFIEMYRSEPCLWQVKNVDYHNRDKKDAAYLKLAEKLRESEPRATKKTVLAKINNLRSAFRREKKKVEDSTKSGAGTAEAYNPSLWYFDLLEFFRDQDMPRMSTSNMESETEELLHDSRFLQKRMDQNQEPNLKEKLADFVQDVALGLQDETGQTAALQDRIEMNWRNTQIKPQVLKCHANHFITCLQFYKNTIVSGSDDNTLKVWDATSGECIRTLTGHRGGVWTLQLSINLIIISGSADRTLRVWDVITGDCTHTLRGHTAIVRCLHGSGHMVVSGSRDTTLRVWNISTGMCEHVLKGHLKSVKCVQYDGRLVVSGAYDNTVKVWIPEREECIYTLQRITDSIYSLLFDGTHVVCETLEGTDNIIRVWDVQTGQCKQFLSGHKSITRCMMLKRNVLISGNEDSTVKVWNIETGQCLQTLSGLNGHKAAVTCLQYNRKFCITSSLDRTVKLWDIKTGQFIRNLVTLSRRSEEIVWHMAASDTKLICAVHNKKRTEETKLLVFNFALHIK